MVSFHSSQFDTVSWEGPEVVPDTEFAGPEVSPVSHLAELKEAVWDVEALEKSVCCDKHNEKEVSENKPHKFRATATKDRKSTRLNSSHSGESRMPSSA